MGIEELYRRKEISVRSYNICIYHNFLDVSDLQEYLNRNFDFYTLKNCGKKSNDELVGLCKSNVISDFKINNENYVNFKSILERLTRIQRSIINLFIILNITNLSPRSQRAIKNHLNGELKVKQFINIILDNDYFNIQYIKNIGIKSIPELEGYIQRIKDFIIAVSDNNNEKHLVALKNKFLIQRTFQVSVIPQDILESESIFKLVDFLINESVLFDSNHTQIFRKTFNIYKFYNDYQLSDIGIELNISSERVRQIRGECFDSLFKKLSFLRNFNDDLLEKYNIDISQSMININDETVCLINRTNKTSFSKGFIIYILYAYLTEYYDLIGNSQDLLVIKKMNARNRHNWKSNYLIRYELLEEFDFDMYVSDLGIKLNDRIEETYKLHFKSYLSSFLKNDNYYILNDIIPIAEIMMNEEFDMYVDMDDNIVFNRTTIKQVYEYAYEALEYLGKPSSVSDIFDYVEAEYSEYKTNIDSIRSSMKKEKGFVAIGKQSIYGLKKWEKELENFKGGTIKEIVLSYLKNLDTPIHILELLDEVHKYREQTSATSILTNLKLDPNEEFIVFNQNFVGLKQKISSYDVNKYEKLPVQLGKTLVNRVKKNSSREDLICYIVSEYMLTYNESLNILKKIGI